MYEDRERLATIMATGRYFKLAYATARGTTTISSYRRLPDACLDDEDELRRWSAIAWQAAFRAPRKTPARRVRRPSAD